MAHSSLVIAAHRFAWTLEDLIWAELLLYRLSIEQAALVFPTAWRMAVTNERQYHASQSSLIKAYMLGVWALRQYHVCGSFITPRHVGQAELQSSALDLPVLNTLA